MIKESAFPKGEQKTAEQKESGWEINIALHTHTHYYISVILIMMYMM